METAFAESGGQMPAAPEKSGGGAFRPARFQNLPDEV